MSQADIDLTDMYVELDCNENGITDAIEIFEGSVEDAKKDEKVIESYLGRGSKLKDN